MSQKQQPATSEQESAVEAAGVALIYADQVAGMAIGPFTSKLVFAVENPGSLPVPIATLVMPTPSLHAMARQLNDLLSDENNKEQFANAFKRYQDYI
jgi:NAD(P)H-dependent flavin oxidoreductase YrpB (nitropropane dioxygenase family)